MIILNRYMYPNTDDFYNNKSKSYIFVSLIMSDYKHKCILMIITLYMYSCMACLYCDQL